MTAQGRVAEAVGESAVHAGDGQGGAQGNAPWLARGVGEQLGHGAGSDAVVGAHAGAVVEEEIVIVHSGVDEKLTDDTRTLLKAAVRALNLAKEAKQQLGVEVVADLVDKRNVLGDGDGDARGENSVVFYWSGHGGQGGAGELKRLSALLGKIIGRI